MIGCLSNILKIKEVLPMEFETVKEALEYLLTLNNLKTRSIVDGHLATVDDYKEFNLEALYSLCDLLGLTDFI